MGPPGGAPGGPNQRPPGSVSGQPPPGSKPGTGNLFGNQNPLGNNR